MNRVQDSFCEYIYMGHDYLKTEFFGAPNSRTGKRRSRRQALISRHLRHVDLRRVGRAEKIGHDPYTHRTILELIDERRDELPLGLAKTLLEACADQPRLYRVTVTRVTAVPYIELVDDETEALVKMQTSTQTLIL